MESILLQAFEGKNKQVPVWFMRQAGRFLPEYRKLKEKHSLKEMFQTPELAAHITCLPVDILGVDAAILFADILTLPAQMGFTVDFTDKGPAIRNPIASPKDVEKTHNFDDLTYVSETIKQAVRDLPGHIPLIGFAGGPFSVFCYLVEGGSSWYYKGAMRFIHEQPDAFHTMMKRLTHNTIDYLNLQRKAGIRVFQIFDTWAGLLRPADYARWVLPYIQEIFKKVDLPSIYYVKNCDHLTKLMIKSNADFVSVCHTVVLGHSLALAIAQVGVQGNLHNGLLYADKKTLEREINDVLQGARHYRRYIFNLSHGIFPDVPVEKVKFVVEQVHAFDWRPIGTAGNDSASS